MTDALALWLGERLLIGSIQGAVILALVWLACLLFPRIPAAAQAALWWLAALKLVLAFTPLPAVPVPVLPTGFDLQTERLFAQPPSAAEEIVAPVWLEKHVVVPGHDDWFVATATTPWFRAVLLAWFLALLIQAGRLVFAHRHLRGVVRRSLAWTDDEIGVLAARLGLTRIPAVRLSGEINSPQVFGLRSPVVLVPTETMAELSDEERTMTLCHELMHIRRRDLVLGWVPACAERLFFFHPLARLGAREYVSAREAACDAAAVRALGVSAGDYGRMLVRLGIGNVSPIVAAGGGAFSKSSLKRRLHMLEHHRLSNLSRRWRVALVVLAAVLIPMQLVARMPDEPLVGEPDVILHKLRDGVTEADGELVLPPPPGSRQGAEPQQGKEVRLRLKVEKLTEPEIGVAVEKAERELQENEEQIRRQERASAKQAKTEKLRAGVEAMLSKLNQARAAMERASADRTKAEHVLQERVRAALSAEPDEATQQALQRLAERLEQLAAEQRALAEELRRLQARPRE